MNWKADTSVEPVYVVYYINSALNTKANNELVSSWLGDVSTLQGTWN